MAVEQRVGPHAALQIDRIADTEPPEIRFEQRLADRRGRVPVALDRYDRQADPVMGDALIDFQFVRERAFEREMPVPAFFADRGDAGCGFDYSRKHGLLLVFMSSGANRFGKSLRTACRRKNYRFFFTIMPCTMNSLTISDLPMTIGSYCCVLAGSSSSSEGLLPARIVRMPLNCSVTTR